MHWTLSETKACEFHVMKSELTGTSQWTRVEYKPICRGSCFYAELCATRWVRRPIESCHFHCRPASECVTGYQEVTTSTTSPSHPGTHTKLHSYTVNVIQVTTAEKPQPLPMRLWHPKTGYKCMYMYIITTLIIIIIIIYGMETV